MVYPATQLLSLLVLALLFLCCVCEAKHKVRCSNSNDPQTSMHPSEDGVKGRYTVEWCTNITKSDAYDPLAEVWNLHVLYNRRNPRICSHKNTHSMVIENPDITHVNCSSVCLSTELDVIFSACYRLENVLKSQGSLRTVTFHKVYNEYTFDTFAKPAITGKEVNHGDYISATFFLGAIPATKYDIELCNMTDVSCNEETRCADVRHACRAGAGVPTELRCRLGALARGGYELRLTHRAPWTVNQLLRDRHTQVLRFNVTADAEAAKVGAEAENTWRRRALVGLGATLGALCVGGALLLAGARLAHAAALRKWVLLEWRRRTEDKADTKPAPVAEATGPILVLYAREGPALTPCIDALMRLLDTVAPGQVFDLYSPVTTALAAGCADAWLRAMVARPHAKLILLQTPALQALHTPSEHHSSEPLLGARSVYRAPLAGDRLLPLALRLAQQDPHPSYNKYYLATISGLETEALPYTVPFRRFVLPAHALALLAALQPAPAASAAPAPAPAPAPATSAAPAPAPAPAPAVSAARRALADELALAARDFVDHARAHPHYLMDELILI